MELAQGSWPRLQELSSPAAPPNLALQRPALHAAMVTLVARAQRRWRGHAQACAEAQPPRRHRRPSARGRGLGEWSEWSLTARVGALLVRGGSGACRAGGVHVATGEELGWWGQCTSPSGVSGRSGGGRAADSQTLRIFGSKGRICCEVCLKCWWQASQKRSYHGLTFWDFLGAAMETGRKEARIGLQWFERKTLIPVTRHSLGTLWAIAVRGSEDETPVPWERNPARAGGRFQFRGRAQNPTLSPCVLKEELNLSISAGHSVFNFIKFRKANASFQEGISFLSYFPLQQPPSTFAPKWMICLQAPSTSLDLCLCSQGELARVPWKWAPKLSKWESWAARVRWRDQLCFSPQLHMKKYFPIWKRDGRTGRSSNKGKTMNFQLVLILVCLPVYVCVHTRERWCSCVEFYRVDFFFCWFNKIFTSLGTSCLFVLNFE